MTGSDGRRNRSLSRLRHGAWLTHTPVGPNPAVTASGDLLKHLSCRAPCHSGRLREKRQCDPQSVAWTLRQKEKPPPIFGTRSYLPVQCFPTVPHQGHAEHCGLMASILVTYSAGRPVSRKACIYGLGQTVGRGKATGWGNCQKPVFC